VEKFRLKLSKSKKDEQIQSIDARITKLELKLGEEKIARKEVRRS
jgi:hypothetical protein